MEAFIQQGKLQLAGLGIEYAQHLVIIGFNIFHFCRREKRDHAIFGIQLLRISNYRQ
jgi:hypothetical protein